MVKKLVAVVAIVSLSLTPISPVNAAVKAGAACPKAGNTAIASGKTFTCIQSGKKLVWDSGTQIKPVTPTIPTSFDDLIKNYAGISYAAWSKSREKILASSKTEITLKMIIGPNSTLDFKEPINPINLVTRLYSGYVKSLEISLLAFSFEDRDWATNQMESILPNSGSQWIKSNACKTQDTCWGGGSFYNGMDRYLIVIATGIGKDNENHTNGTLEAHEFTHSLQQLNMGKGRPAAQFLYDPWPPNWYWEGQAQYTQNAAIFFDDFLKYSSQRKKDSIDLFKQDKFNSDIIQKYFVFNAPKDWQANYDQWRQYDLGAMFVEILTALKGPDSTMEMWKLAASGMNFRPAFFSVYGIDFDKALPIMAKAIALELGHS